MHALKPKLLGNRCTIYIYIYGQKACLMVQLFPYLGFNALHPSTGDYGNNNIIDAIPDIFLILILKIQERVFNILIIFFPLYSQTHLNKYIFI